MTSQIFTSKVVIYYYTKIPVSGPETSLYTVYESIRVYHPRGVGGSEVKAVILERGYKILILTSFMCPLNSIFQVQNYLNRRGRTN